MKTCCLIQVPYDLVRSIRAGQFRPEALPEEVAELTPAQSLSRFYNNPKFDVELVPQEHTTAYLAIVRTADE